MDNGKNTDKNHRFVNNLPENVNSKKTDQAPVVDKPINGRENGNVSREITDIPQQNLPIGVTLDGVVKCRFYLFVSVYLERRFRFQGREGPQETWWFPGSKYTDKAPEMLRNLLRLASRKINDYRVLIVYDTTKPQDNDENVVIKIFKGRVEENRLNDYQTMLDGITIPEKFKTNTSS